MVLHSSYKYLPLIVHLAFASFPLFFSFFPQLLLLCTHLSEILNTN